MAAHIATHKVWQTICKVLEDVHGDRRGSMDQTFALVKAAGDLEQAYLEMPLHKPDEA